MSQDISLVGAIAALILPWVCGSAVVYLLLKRSANHWNAFIVAGQGYPLGLMITCLLLYLWNLAGLNWTFWPIAGLLLAATVAAIVFARRIASDGNRARLQQRPKLPAWQWACIALLLGLVCYRYFGIAQELLLRPLFPWDAWMNWAPKPIVWYHFGHMVDWVSPHDWLRQSGELPAYTAGAGNAWKYPDLLPLVQLWGMLGVGTSDHTLVYVPWLLVALALGLATYGHLRLAAIGPLASTVAAYLLVNLPFLTVHVALAGYGDLWVTAFFGCAILSLSSWNQGSGKSYALLAAVLATGCALLKMPGLIMAGIVLITAVSCLVVHTRTAVIATLCALGIAITVLIIGMDMEVPGLGQVVISLSGIKLPYLGEYAFSYHAVSDAVINTTLVMLNWNLLAYLALIVLIIAACSPKHFRQLPAEAVASLLTLSFVGFVYYFTKRYEFALDYTQINRALIYSVVPITLFVVRVGCRADGPPPNNNVREAGTQLS